jgi:hypothetical protein
MGRYFVKRNNLYGCDRLESNTSGFCKESMYCALEHCEQLCFRHKGEILLNREKSA